MQQGDQRPEYGQVREEGQGTVDRVDHPDELGIRRCIAAFLAGNPVIGHFGRDQLADAVLGSTVDRRYGAAVALLDDLECLLVHGVDAGAACIRQPPRKFPELLHF